MVIEIDGVSKSYGGTLAVDAVSFVAPVGSVTGFLGPNGAGKTTTLRLLLGLARPDEGAALIDGVPYVSMASPRHKVGAVAEPGFHPGRTGRDHLRVIARSVGISQSRVDEVLEFVDLTDAATRRVGGYSHGMRQRLALAGAVLCDPPVLVLDEPSNGLDPAGMAWLRGQLRQWATEGRTVLFSSHVLSDVEAVADRVVIINRGRVVRDGMTVESSGTGPVVVVRTPDSDRLQRLVGARNWTSVADGDRLLIEGASIDEIGRLAATENVILHELSVESTSKRLEDLFLELTIEEVAP